MTITATPSAGATIDWYAAATGGSPLQSGSTVYTPSITTTTTYYAQARNTTTSCVSTPRTAVTATVIPTPNVPTLNASANQCAGTGVTFTASGGSAYDWAGAFTGSGNPKVSATTAGTYTARVRNVVTINSVNCYSAYTANVTRYVNPTPATPVLATTGNQCAGTGVTFNATGGTAYDWAGAFNTQTGNSKTSSTATGTYTTSVRNAVTANGITCYSAYTANVNGYVNPTPVTPSYDWTGAFTGSGVTKVSPTIEGTYTARVRNVVTANSKTCYSAYTANVTGYVNCGGDPGVTITVGTVTWAGRNVDEPNKFADRADMYTQFYQFNRKVGYGATNPPAGTAISGWTSSINENTDWTTANNPCPDGWRVPSNTEWTALNATGSSWANANTRGNSVAGRFFGPNRTTCSLPSDMIGCIFLPAVGIRYYTNGRLAEQATVGYYWSSTQNNNTISYNWHINSSSSNPNTNNKAWGRSVRCVKDN